MPHSKDILHVSGYWSVPQNTKRSESHYEIFYKKTLDFIIDGNLVFLSDSPEFAKKVKDACRDRSINLNNKTIDIPSLPARPLAASVLKSTINMNLDVLLPPINGSREKAVIHYWRDLKGSGKDAYYAILTIWLSKIYILAQISRQLDKQFKFYAWMDISVSRFNGQRSQWDLSQLILDETKINHYPSNMQMYGKELPLNASYLAATPEAWARLEKLYHKKALRLSTMPYGHDEETILSECIRTSPSLFNLIS